MRGRKAAINSAFMLIEEGVAVICGFILPRLILKYFGSQYNGLTTSITLFLAGAVLLRSGIGGATRAALYKPLAEKDWTRFSGIVKATDLFMKRIALILAAVIFVFGAIYPLFVRNEFGWFFTFTLFLIIGASSFAESFFGITYMIVLQADQKVWVSNAMRAVCFILNTAVAAFVIINGGGIHAVKLVSATVFVLYPIAISLYVKKRYPIDKSVAPDMSAISQRWDAFWQQVALYVTNGAPMMILTFFSNMLEASVFAVYNMVSQGLLRVVLTVTHGLESAFGNMIAKKEYSTLATNVRVIETLSQTVCAVVYTCAILLIVDFVRIYTKGVEDVDYIRVGFAYVLMIGQYFNGVRLPYQLVVQAAGHYKQTRNASILEPILNIIVSTALVFRFGVLGVAIGTLVATVYRTLQYSIHMSRHIVKRSVWLVGLRTALSAGEFMVVWGIMSAIDHFSPEGALLWLRAPSGYLQWTCKAFVVGGVSVVVVALGTALFYREDAREMLGKIRNVFVKEGRRRRAAVGVEEEKTR